MTEQFQGSRGKTARTDEEIIQFFCEHPTSTIDYARRVFQCGTRRAGELRHQAQKIMKEIPHTKKKGGVSWREHFEHSKESQRLKNKKSWSQDYAIVDVQKQFNTKDPIVIMFLADIHIGSLATNYHALEEITDGILNTPNLYVILNGDLTETTVQFKNALAVHSQSMDIETQHEVLESWLEEIAPKVISAGWDNHAIEREEKWGAFSNVKRMLNRKFIYHNGMGRLDIVHGEATYRLVISHKIAGYSIFNQLHGAKRLIRLQFPNCDIIATGDRHTPDIETYYEGEFKRAAIMNGSLKINDGYSKRYFSLFTHMDMPCIVLFPDEKNFTVHMNSWEALSLVNGYSKILR